MEKFRRDITVFFVTYDEAKDHCRQAWKCEYDKYLYIDRPKKQKERKCWTCSKSIDTGNNAILDILNNFIFS